MAKGQKKTGGRQKGSRNKRTQEREEATAQAIALIGEAIPDAFAGDAHAFLVAVYKNPKLDHHTRQDAAKAALPYEKPRLQAVKLANLYWMVSRSPSVILPAASSLLRR